MARGSIEKRDGATGIGYRVRVEYPADPVTGKRRQRSQTFTTKKAAQAALAKWVAEIDGGTAVEPTRLTVADLCRKWLDTVAAHKVRPTTLAGYRATVEAHVIPALGHVPAQKLTAAAVQEFYADKLAAGASPRTVQLCALRLSQALAQGVKWGMLPRNVCEAADPPRAAHKPGATWTPEEARRFLKAAEGDPLSPLWLVLLATGLRRGEALGLRWADLDADKGTLHVRQSVVMLHGAPCVQEPKSAAARRTVRLDAATVAALTAHRKRQVARRLALGPVYDPAPDLIFATGEGKPLNPNNVLRSFARIVAAADVPRIRIHDLRHTHATWLLKDGQPVKVVSERLGHAKTSITMDVYAHTLPGMQDGAADAIGALLSEASA